MKKEIIDLTDKWYKYVSQDHHKDRDCHWYIEADFAYGDEPTFTAYHLGYIADDLRGASRTTYQEAEGDLLELIYGAINKEREWVNGVLKEPSRWDEEQVSKANLFVKLFTP